MIFSINSGICSGCYSGHGDWAPIMGSGYYKSVTQWSKGEYPGANQLQDDLAVMQTYGIPVIADDYGNKNAAATVLSGSSISASGKITTRSNVDVFQFSTGDGVVTINLNPAPSVAIFVKSISMSLVTSGRQTSARAVITVNDGNSALPANVTVTGNWSGLTTGSFTGTTNASGQVIITSASTKKTGAFTINVTNLSASGYTYNPNQNVVTSASISN